MYSGTSLHRRPESKITTVVFRTSEKHIICHERKKKRKKKEERDKAIESTTIIDLIYIWQVISITDTVYALFPNLYVLFHFDQACDIVNTSPIINHCHWAIPVHNWTTSKFNSAAWTGKKKSCLILGWELLSHSLT